MGVAEVGVGNVPPAARLTDEAQHAAYQFPMANMPEYTDLERAILQQVGTSLTLPYAGICVGLLARRLKKIIKSIHSGSLFRPALDVPTQGSA